jgi:hypothetical protein
VTTPEEVIDVVEDVLHEWLDGDYVCFSNNLEESYKVVLEVFDRSAHTMKWKIINQGTHEVQFFVTSVQVEAVNEDGTGPE